MYSKKGLGRSAESHYPTMELEDIQALPVGELADTDCILFMWTTIPLLKDCFSVMKAWGFKYKTCAFVWVKTKKDGEPLAGMGSYTKANAELCLLGMRGHLKSVDKTVRQIVMQPRLGHSVKPPLIRDEIVRLFGDVLRIELFARQKVFGWDCWGNEVNEGGD